MADFANASAGIRITDEDRKSICAVTNVNPAVTADTATAFVRAIEKIHNNGTCTGRLNIAYKIA